MATSHWFIGGGAEHTAEMVRRDTYAKLKGAEGVCEVGDMRVLPTAVPGGAVRITIGSVYVNSLYSGAVRETYMGSVVTQETVAVPQNTEGSPRRDLIVARFKDPYVQGSPWPDPGAGIEDPDAAAEARAGAQYLFIERVPSVPGGTTRLQDVAGFESDTAYTLARIDIPASTGTITSAMITDLRQVHTRRLVREMRINALQGEERETLVATAENGEWFPNAGALQYIDVPVWATRMQIEGDWIGCLAGPGQSSGACWVEFGPSAGGNSRIYKAQGNNWNIPETPDSKAVQMATATEMSVPAAVRGVRQVPFIMKARIKTSSGNDARPYMNPGSSTKLCITFYEDALSVSDS
ncbi:hypothetical protein MUN77_01610 [Leucobacter allii]|uniref:hypothetical protein n=1 Tax=Leucobacter allii TaxID=2932247 RepID=UPI001FD1501A|nr:hypothetical protein [Leucobacter allii]UOR02056.1 hypothetical protein MUN77_01610 [Leucobacter allii]